MTVAARAWPAIIPMPRLIVAGAFLVFASLPAPVGAAATNDDLGKGDRRSWHKAPALLQLACLGIFLIDRHLGLPLWPSAHTA